MEIIGIFYTRSIPYDNTTSDYFYCSGLLFERLGKKLYLTERGRLLRAELDVGIVEGEILSPDLTVLPIIEDCLILAVGKYHSFYHRNCIHVRDLAGETFTMRERGSGTRQ
ncbi:MULTISPECIES: LysR substrate-binding domain-containing protein [Blautia]|uniref:LysR substrate-binding domain-containing protein n=1 Tax=Blautia TaxID=572511 RepID=UPI002FE65136